jgi:hypothetical protein
MAGTNTKEPESADAEKVFGARILSLGDGNAPGYLQLANIWMILNVGGGPTPDKPTVTLSVPDPNHINSFMNFRVADIQACYELWKSRGAEFITERSPSTARRAATSAILTDISSRSDRAQTSNTVNVRPGKDCQRSAPKRSGTVMRNSLL